MKTLATKVCHAVEQRGDDVNAEMRERVDAVLTRELHAAINAECTCGGKPFGPFACPACMVWHRIKS